MADASLAAAVVALASVLVASAAASVEPPASGTLRSSGRAWAELARVQPRAPAPAPAPRAPDTPELRLETPEGRVLYAGRPFDADGEPIAGEIAAISSAFRTKAGDTVPIHPRLCELLLTLSLAHHKPIVLISGHRAAGRGTGRKSYHVRGMAADIAIRGVNVRELRKTAVRLGAWGVGLYPHFVHVDVRQDQPYRWAWGFGRSRSASAVR